MKKYIVRIQRKGDSYPAYHVKVDSDNIEEATKDAIDFLVMNAWWPSDMSTEDKKSHLTVCNVEEFGNVD